MDHSKIRDRGTKKWSMTMMLPEHVEKLREFSAEQMKVPKPQLDSFDYDLLEEEISLGYISKAEISVKVWKDGFIEEIRGVITEVSMIDRSILVEEPLKSHRIKIQEIVSVHSLT